MLWVPSDPVSVSLERVEGRVHCSLLPQRSGSVWPLYHSPRYTLRFLFCLTAHVTVLLFYSKPAAAALRDIIGIFRGKHLLIVSYYQGLRGANDFKMCPIFYFPFSSLLFCSRFQAAVCLRTAKPATMEHGRPMTTSSSTESIAQSVAKAGVVGTVKVSWTAVMQYRCKALSRLNILHLITDYGKYGSHSAEGLSYDECSSCTLSFIWCTCTLYTNTTIWVKTNKSNYKLIVNQVNSFTKKEKENTQFVKQRTDCQMCNT